MTLFEHEVRWKLRKQILAMILSAALVSAYAIAGNTTGAAKNASALSPVEKAERLGKIVINPKAKFVVAKTKTTGKKSGRSIASVESTPASPPGKPVLHLNSEHYKDNGAKPGTGRSGKSALMTRALRNKDGRTDLEITTGVIDNPTSALGTIVKVQLKSLNAAGEVRYVRNYNNLASGAYLKFALNDVQRGQPLQIQGNVRGVDPKRTDVVTVQETVRLRPDLRAQNLTLQPKAILESPVNIAATINEMNHDVGAESDCVLYVDGVATDRANGIWVDAGGAVSCVFTQIFSTIGKKSIEIKLENVAPTDYDTSNNSATGQIEIVSNDGNLNYSFYARDYNFTYHQKYDNYWRDLSSSYDQNQDYGGVWDETGRRQELYGSAYKTGVAFNFPITSLSSKESTDGNQLFTSSFSNVDADFTWDFTDGSYTQKGGCFSRVDSVTNIYVNFCQYNYSDAATGTPNPQLSFSQLYYQRYAVDAVYQSTSYSHIWYRYDGSDYFYTGSNNSQTNIGSFPVLGSSYGLDLNVSDGTNSGVANVSIPLSPFNYSYEQPYTCNEVFNDPYYTKYCGDYSYSQTGRFGYAYK